MVFLDAMQATQENHLWKFSRETRPLVFIATAKAVIKNIRCNHIRCPTITIVLESPVDSAPSTLVTPGSKHWTRNTHTKREDLTRENLATQCSPVFRAALKLNQSWTRWSSSLATIWALTVIGWLETIPTLSEVRHHTMTTIFVCVCTIKTTLSRSTSFLYPCVFKQ